MAYHQTKFSLSKTQLKKIASAVRKNEEFTLRLGKSIISNRGYNLPLTRTQLNKLSDGNLHDIKFSLAQVKHIDHKIGKHANIKEGGLLPLVTLIPLIASALGAAGGVAGTIAGRVQQHKADKEQQRHNQEMERLAKAGKGLRL